MEPFDEKLVVSDLIGDLRGACGNTGRGPGKRRHLARPAATRRQPKHPLSAPATSPLQQQMQDDYATQLKGAQESLLQQNSSGLTRQERSVGHALNGFTPR